MDTVSPSQRSYNMSRIKSKDTTPEMIVRKTLYKMGIRYRIHAGSLPGTPDIVIKKYKLIIDVRGCFWHGHENCKFSSSPKSNTSYWSKKIKRNKERDMINLQELEKRGYKVFVIWECQTKTENSLLPEFEKIQEYLSKKKSGGY